MNGGAKKASYSMCVGDKVSVTLPQPTEYALLPWDIPLSIVYEDTSMLVVNKPAGMVVHPACGHMDNKTLVNALLHHCTHLSGINGVLRPGIVHRLDKDTSGLMVVAKEDRAHHRLAEQLASRTLSRCYMALCYGRCQEDSFMVKTHIGRSPQNRKKMAVLRHSGKEAVSHFTVRCHLQGYTLLEVSLETGRTHQIRVHASYKGYPIVGDMLYTGGRKGYKEMPAISMKRQALHAYKIGFMHPKTGKQMCFETSLPEDMQQALYALGVTSLSIAEKKEI